MKNTWRHFFRRLARIGSAAGAIDWCSAVCYAQFAADFTTDPVYTDGWQAGDNGGFGFTAWNFDGSYASTDQHSIDDGLKSGGATSSTFNDLGKAWRLSNTVVTGGQRDIARAGRGFAPLQVGQSVRVVVDNPNEQQFFRGYFVRLNGGTGGMNGNICYQGNSCTPGGTPDSKFRLQMFDYFTDGRWSVIGDNSTDASLFDVDTDMGFRMDFTLTGPETYLVAMTPLDNPTAAFMHSGSLANPGVPIDWIEFTFFNTQSNVGAATDFYIRSLEIIGAAPAGVPGDYNANGDVDDADYIVWRDRVGQSFQLANEVAGVTPGMVTPEDYSAWRSTFGNTGLLGSGNGSGLGSVVAAAVPEPNAIWVFVIGIVGMLMHGRSGRQNDTDGSATI